MKNYYDELEVSKTASKEVIEKVYKLLAKKYHPDTTKEADKFDAEEKFKIISEAYEILSDDEKRKKYDLELEQSNPTVSYEEYITVVNQRDSLNTDLNNLKNEFNQYINSNNINDQYSNSSQEEYNNTHYNHSNSTYNNYQNTNQSYYTRNHNSTTQKKTYYYTSTGKPASAFAYFKYKLKNFFFNLSLIILSIIAAFFIFNAFSNFNFFRLFIR